MNNSAGNLEALVFPRNNVISIKNISKNNFIIATAEEIAQANKQHLDLKILRQWIECEEKLSAKLLAALIHRIKCIA